MAINIPAGMYLAKLRWRLTGDADEMVSTIGLRNNEPGERDLNDVAHAVYDAWNGAWGGQTLCTGWSFVGVDVIEGTGGSETNVGTWNQVVAGTSNAAPLPTNCALLLKKKTASAGRRNTGRMFLPAGYLAEADVSPTGIITQDTMTVHQASSTEFYNSLRDSTQPVGVLATSFMPVIFHSNTTDPPAPGGAPTDITSLVLDPLIATQRRRMRR